MYGFTNMAKLSLHTWAYIMYRLLIAAILVTVGLSMTGFLGYVTLNFKEKGLKTSHWFQQILNSWSRISWTYKSPQPYVNTTRDPKCLERKFANTLLVIGFGAPSEYESIPLFELLYKKVFMHRLYCGSTMLQNQTEIDMLVVDTRNGAFLYECLHKAMETHTTYTGYLYVGEDILINYWNLLNLDFEKIWEDATLQQGPILYQQQASPTWEWFHSPWGKQAMEKVYEYFVELNYYDSRKSKQSQGEWLPAWDVSQSLNKWLWNGRGNFACYSTNKTVLYIPRSYASSFTNISKHFRASGVRQEIAIATIIRLITLEESNVKLTSVEINQDNRKKFLEERSTLMVASQNAHIISVAGSRKERRGILNHLRLKEYAVGRFLEYKQC